MGEGNGNGITVTAPPGKRLSEPAGQATTLPEGRAQAWRQWLVVLVLVFSDILLALVVWEAASTLHSISGRGPLSEVASVTIMTSAVIWIGMRALLGLYPGYGLDQVGELRRQSIALAGALAVTAVVALAFHVGDALSRLLLALGFLGLLLLAPLVRHFVKRGLGRGRLWGKPVAIMGAGEAGARLVRTLQEEWTLGLRPIVVFDNRTCPAEGILEGVPYGGTLTDAVALARRQKVDTAIFAMPYTRRDHVKSLVDHARLHFRHVVIIPNLGGITTSAVTARDFAGIFGVEIKHNLLDPWALRTKWALDLGATVVVGILTLPLLLVLCLLVYLESGGRVFYRDQRMGQDGKPFSCIKFRTMEPDAEAKLQQMLKEDAQVREEYLKYHKLRHDPRVTRVGRFLRKTSLDELPQLWNVLRGEMSLVGPRPYLLRESGEIGTAQHEILRVPPGITGLWQVAGRNHASFTERVQMDSYYVRNWSVWLDFLILARTAKSLVLGRGAF